MLTKSVLLIAAATCLAHAQIVSLSEPGIVGSSVMTSLTNNGSSPITAYLIVCRMYEGSKKRLEHHIYMDARVNFVDAQITPGGTQTVTLIPAALAKRFRYEVQLEGTVFADGTSFGDPAPIALIRERRQRVYDALKTYDPLIRNSWQSGGRSATSTAIQAEHVHQQSLAAIQHLDAPRVSAEDLVAHYVSDSIGKSTDACDTVCADKRLAHVLDGLASWERLVESGLNKKSQQ